MDKYDRIIKFSEVLSNKIVGPALHPTYQKPFIKWLDEGGYFNAPASLKYHGAYDGGLFDHSNEVANILDWYTRKLKLGWQRQCSPWIIGLFHDLCKMDNYIPEPELSDEENERRVEPPTAGWEYNEHQLLRGHGEKSVMLLSRFMALTEEEILCIRYHMGAYNKEDWEGFDLAIRKYPNVLYTHTADMAASKIYNI